MKNNKLLEAISGIDADILEDHMKMKEKTGKRPASFVRTLAIAAAIMLLAAGMIAALPLLRANPELPPDPATDPVIGESTTEEIQGTDTIAETTEKKYNWDSIGLWEVKASFPYAIIEVLEITDEKIYGGKYSVNLSIYYNKIKCRVIYAYYTTTILGKSDEDFLSVNEIYVPSSALDEIKENSIALVGLDKIILNNTAAIRAESNGSIYYLPIKDGRLAFDDYFESSAMYQVFSEINKRITGFALLDEKYYDDAIRAFPKKEFCDKMTVEEVIEYFKCLRNTLTIIREERANAKNSW